MKLERVVIGMDFSGPALEAARWTAKYLAPDAELVLLHVMEIPHPPPFLRGTLSSASAIEENARQGAELRLKEVGRSLGDVRVWPEVRIGRAAHQIVEVAKEYRANLIVVGEHGHSGGIRGILGSTAEHLARSAPIPVLLAQALPKGAPRRILLPLEESNLMRTALDWGRFLAERTSAEVVGCYVVSSSLLARMRMVSSVERAEKLEAEVVREAREWLEAQLHGAGISNLANETRVVIGDPATEILATAEESGCDLIVLPTRGAGGIGDALIGSVARSVIRGARSPILIVNQARKA